MSTPLPEESLARLEALARLMDGAFVIPGTSIRVGLDAIIGIVPGIGDAISGVISSYLIWEARKLGVSRWTLTRMAANTLLDTTVGAIPLAGDVFDVMFRANMKNMALLRRHLERKGHTGRFGPVIEGEAVRIN
jgi:sugar (pentulose or hexulose) kinase